MSLKKAVGGLGAVLVMASLGAPAAGSGPGTAPLGSIVCLGSVRIDNAAATSGTALFDGEVVTTGISSRAILVFPTRAAAQIDPQSELQLSGGTPMKLELRRGRVSIRSFHPQGMDVEVLGASVKPGTAAGGPTFFQIASTGKTAAVFARTGRVEIQAGGKSLTLVPGYYAELSEGGMPQGGGEVVGNVVALVPDVVVRRPPGVSEVYLVLHELVARNNIIRTLRFGRVEIEFFGGSSFNLGSLSTAKVLNFDSASHQAAIELREGPLSGEPAKTAGAAFQVLTPTAAVQAMGRFVIDARPRSTLVCAADGTALVRNVSSALTAEVALRSGECVGVALDHLPGNPLRAAKTIREEMARTAVVKVPTWKTLAPKSAPETAHAAAAGAKLTGAVLSVVAIKSLGDSSNSLESAQARFKNFKPPSTGLPTAANGLLNASEGLCGATLEFEHALSPSAPLPSCP